MKRPLVSVVIPVYNGEKEIEKCLRSVMKQNMDDMEIIVVNDGSTDHTEDILRALEKEDSRIRVIYQQNAGVSAARNRGLEEATGEYIRFADADDQLTENGIRVMVDAIRKEGSELVIAGYKQLLLGKMQRKNLYKKDETVSIEQTLKHMNGWSNSFYYGVLWNKLFVGDVIRRHNIRFRNELKLAEDFTFICHYMHHVNRVTYITDEVYEYHRNGSGLTMQHCMDCVWHPFANIGLKKFLYQQLKDLYIAKGQYPLYRHTLWLYLFRITLTN